MSLAQRSIVTDYVNLGSPKSCSAANRSPERAPTVTIAAMNDVSASGARSLARAARPTTVRHERHDDDCQVAKRRRPPRPGDQRQTARTGWESPRARARQSLPRRRSGQGAPPVASPPLAHDRLEPTSSSQTDGRAPRRAMCPPSTPVASRRMFDGSYMVGSRRSTRRALKPSTARATTNDASRTSTGTSGYSCCPEAAGGDQPDEGRGRSEIDPGHTGVHRERRAANL